jgi:hypothetical protein
MASKTLQAWHDNIRTLEPPTTATHRCRVCRAFWRVNDDGSWSLASKLCGECCDNEAMGEQIAPADQSDPEARLAEAERTVGEKREVIATLAVQRDKVDALHQPEVRENYYDTHNETWCSSCDEHWPCETSAILRRIRSEE